MPQPTVQNELFTRLTNCAKTPAQWANTAGTPMLGEPCWEIQEAQTATGLPYSYRLKIGDGKTSYANLPYYGDFVTLHTANNTALSVAVWDGTNSQLNFYKVTETNGIVALEQNPYLRLKAGSKVTISTSTVGGVNVLQINHQEQSNEDITEDTATLTDGGTFRVATDTDDYGHVIEWTTFTLPSIATAIDTAIDALDSSVASSGNVYVLKSITEVNGKLTAKTETQIVGGTNMSVVGAADSITINHDPIDQTSTDAASGITTDNSSTVGEKNMDIITGFKVDAQGHVIHIDKDKSTNLIAADIKAPVRMTDNSMWSFRETGGNISINEDVAKIPVLKGKSLVWNQIVGSSTTSVTLVSGRRYYTAISGTNSIQTGAGSSVSVTGGTDMVTDLTKLFGSDDAIAAALGVAVADITSATAVANFEKLFPNSYYPYCEGRLVNLGGYGVKMNQLVDTDTSSVTLESGRKYYTVISGTKAVQTGAGSAVSVTGGTDMVIDLTLMFGAGNEPSLEECEQIFTQDYYEYNTGYDCNILDLTGGKLGVKSTGFNLWDSSNRVDGYYINWQTGAETVGTSNSHTGFVRVLPDTDYYFKQGGTSGQWGAFYDSNKNYLEGLTNFGVDGGGVSHTPAGCAYVRISLDATDASSNICINLSDTNKNGTYEPYMADTLDLDWVRTIKDSNGDLVFPYGLLSAGSVYDEVQEGKLIKRVGVVDLGTLDWRETWKWNNYHVLECSSLTGIIANGELTVPPNGILSSSKYTLAGYNNWNYDKTLTVWNDGVLNICNLDINDTSVFIQDLSGIKFCYELATPIEIPLDHPHNMTYAVADHGTEQQLPVSAYSPLNAPFAGEFQYMSNFKDSVLDLINRVNDYRNPVRGKNDSAQEVGKLAEYDSDSTVKSSIYSPSNATIVAGADGNEYILPSVAALVAYVQNLISSALHYKGTVASWSALPSSGQQIGDLYVFSAEDSSHTPPVNIGDFAIWNGTSWDLIQGKVSVTNSNPTLVLNGQTYTIGTVEGTTLTLVTPNLQMSDPTANGNANNLEVITNVSQNNGQLSAQKKVIPPASVSQKGVVQLERDIHYSESQDKVPSAGQTWRELSKRNVKAVPITVVPVPAIYNTDLFASYELEGSSNPAFTVNNSTFAEVYAASMGGYLFYVNNGVVYAAKMKASDWTKFDDDTAITSAIRAATETMIHVPTCNYKASGKKMKFGGLNPLYGGDYFKSPRWVGAYQMDDNGHSRPGVGSGHSKTMSAFWNLAQAIHSDFGLANYEFHNLINALYQAMFGNLNSEYVLSDGNSRSSDSWDKYRDLEHGKADSLADGAFVTGPHCVAAVDGAGVTRYVTKFCGFEDLFGKLWEFRPGIRFYMDNGVRKAVVYDGNVVSNSAQGRVLSGVLASASGEYTTAMELGEHWDMLPKTVGGSSTTYYCDGYWAATDGELLIVGGSAYPGSPCGISCSYSGVGFSAADVSIGARLAFYGEPIIVSGAEMVAMMA